MNSQLAQAGGTVLVVVQAQFAGVGEEPRQLPGPRPHADHVRTVGSISSREDVAGVRGEVERRDCPMLHLPKPVRQ